MERLSLNDYVAHTYAKKKCSGVIFCKKNKLSSLVHAGKVFHWPRMLPSFNSSQTS